ncbi:MAG: LysR family transcriptional regulator [Stackebrandtia sp.]
MFDPRHLTTFREVIRAGSYSAAARSLGYTQPAITQQMRALEREAGTVLFTRVRRRMRLTEAGEALARHAEIILDKLSDAGGQLEAYGRLRCGTVRLCAFPSANATLVPDALARITANHPGIHVELQEDEPPESLWRLVHGDCDLTLAFTYPGMREAIPDEVVEIPLLEDQLTVVLPAGHQLARRQSVKLSDLACERWIAGCLRCRANLLHECAEQGFAPDIAFTTDDNLVVQSLVAKGLGIAMMPGLVFDFLRHRRITVRPLEPASRRQVYAYLLREHRKIPATTLLVDELKLAAANRVGC